MATKKRNNKKSVSKKSASKKPLIAVQKRKLLAKCEKKIVGKKFISPISL